MLSVASVAVAFADIVAVLPAVETAVIVVPAGISPAESEIGRPTWPWVNAPDDGAVTVVEFLVTPAVTVGFKIHFCNPPSPTVALLLLPPSVVQTVSGPLESFFGLPVSATYNTVGLAKKKFCGLKLTLSPVLLRLLPLLVLPDPCVLMVYLPVAPVLPRPAIKAGP